MRYVGRFFLGLIIAVSCGHAAFSEPSVSGGVGSIDQDPLRHYLPDDNTFMPVPGGVSALTTPNAEATTIEEKAAQLHGGLIVGYCLRASCRYVTHLVVIQVCFNQISGPEGTDKLVLAIVRLPYGNKPGHLKSLQGRDYAYNFEAYGPYEQAMPLGTLSDKVEAAQKRITLANDNLSSASDDVTKAKLEGDIAMAEAMIAAASSSSH